MKVPQRWLMVFTLGLLLVSAMAADWAQWRGPKRDGHSADTGLLKEWPKEGPKLVWQQNDVGGGYGGPAVVGDRIYLVSNTGLDKEYVQALDAANGKQVWATTIGKVGNPKQMPAYPAARSTPTVDGSRLFALGSDGALACLETESGKLVWSKSLTTDFGGVAGVWAYAESPLVDGEALICTPGGKDATMVALNKANGDVFWKCPVPGGDAAGYSSPIAIEAAGVKQYVQFLAKGVVGVEAKSGKFLWRYDGTGKGPANMPTPVVSDGLVYTSASRIGGGLVKLESEGDKIVAKQVYFERGLPFSIGGSVLVNGNHFGTVPDGLVCADFATGKVKWKDKCIGAGSTLVAEGLLFIHGENNMMALVEASPEGYREKGRFALPNPPKRVAVGRQPPETAWAYPALANGRLYVRDLGVLWCYDVKAP